MRERVKVSFYLPEENEYLYAWSFESIKDYDFERLGYELYNIGTNDYILVQYDKEDKYNTKIYSTTQKVTHYGMEEIKEIVDCINRAYFYIDISDKVSIVLDYDRDLDKDRTRKKLNNYFDSYKEAQKKYNKIIEVIRGEVINSEK